MKSIKSGGHSLPGLLATVARAFIVAGFLFVLMPMGHAVVLAPGGGGTNSSPDYTQLESWSFHDHINWTSDAGYAPFYFTNLDYSYLGDGASLVVNNSNQLLLQYNVLETDGKTNLTVDSGTVMFWFAPQWASTNRGGTGPGEFGRLLEVGAYTPDSSYGLWSIYVDDVGENLYFSTQTNDLSSNLCTFISAPISWTTNYFHFVALTYSPTNTALYLDGDLATNGPPLTNYPGPDVLANGLFIGSDSNGVNQAQGMFNNVATFNGAVDAGTVLQTFHSQYIYYMLNHMNSAMFVLSSASSSPSFSSGYQAISGAGNLQYVGESLACLSNSAASTYTNLVWLTNVTVSAAGNKTMNVTFSIGGGVPGVPYDVFATAALQAPIGNATWVWLGQGFVCSTYTINIPSANAFLILGTPLDSNNNGVTDAYEDLISHTDPHSTNQTDTNGVPIAWYIQNGLDPSSGMQDTDGDALLNYQEYLFGTNPRKSEGFSVWIGAANGTSVIP